MDNRCRSTTTGSNSKQDPLLFVPILFLPQSKHTFVLIQIYTYLVCSFLLLDIN